MTISNYSDSDNPYPGLRPFDEKDSRYFRGRRGQVTALLSRLEKRRFVAVVGSSGCGKSSLVRAGIVAQLRLGNMPSAGRRWRVAIMRPGNAPFAALAAALLEERRQLSKSLVTEKEKSSSTIELGDHRPVDPNEIVSLTGRVRGSSSALFSAIRDYGLLAEGERLLVIVDQFEEIFRYRREKNVSDAAEFVSLLVQTACDAARYSGQKETSDSLLSLPKADQEVARRVFVLLTMRSDFLGQCSLFDGLPELLNDSQFLTPRLSPTQIKDAIEVPVRLVDGEVTPELSSALLTDMQSVILGEGGEEAPESDQLPLLQHALRRIWQEARKGDQANYLSVADYDQITRSPTQSQNDPILPAEEPIGVTGRLSTALNIHAEELYDQATHDSPFLKILIEWVFRCITERYLGKETRRPTSLRQIAIITVGALVHSSTLTEDARRLYRELLDRAESAVARENDPTQLAVRQRLTEELVYLQRAADAAKQALHEDSSANTVQDRALIVQVAEAAAQEAKKQLPELLDDVLADVYKDLNTVLEPFRDANHAFVTPFKHTQEPLTPDNVIDLTHEVLLRRWNRLRDWMRNEAKDRDIFNDLEKSALGRRDSLTGRNLADALKWQLSSNPTRAWAVQYKTFVPIPTANAGDVADSTFDVAEGRTRTPSDFSAAMNFLKESEESAEKARKQQEERDQQDKVFLETQTRLAKSEQQVAEAKAAEEKTLRKNAELLATRAVIEKQRTEAEKRAAQAVSAAALAEREREAETARAEQKAAESREFQAVAESEIKEKERILAESRAEEEKRLRKRAEGDKQRSSAISLVSLTGVAALLFLAFLLVDSKKLLVNSNKQLVETNELLKQKQSALTTSNKDLEQKTAEASSNAKDAVYQAVLAKKQASIARKAEAKAIFQEGIAAQNASEARRQAQTAKNEAARSAELAYKRTLLAKKNAELAKKNAELAIEASKLAKRANENAKESAELKDVAIKQRDIAEKYLAPLLQNPQPIVQDYIEDDNVPEALRFMNLISVNRNLRDLQSAKLQSALTSAVASAAERTKTSVVVWNSLERNKERDNTCMFGDNIATIAPDEITIYNLPTNGNSGMQVGQTIPLASLYQIDSEGNAQTKIAWQRLSPDAGTGNLILKISEKSAGSPERSDTVYVVAPESKPEKWYMPTSVQNLPSSNRDKLQCVQTQSASKRLIFVSTKDDTSDPKSKLFKDVLVNIDFADGPNEFAPNPAPTPAMPRVSIGDEPKVIRLERTSGPNAVPVIKISPSGEYIAVSMGDGHWRVFNSRSKIECVLPKPELIKKSTVKPTRLIGCAFPPSLNGTSSDKTLITLFYSNGFIQFGALDKNDRLSVTGKEKRIVSTNEAKFLTEASYFSYSPDGKRFTIVTDNAKKQKEGAAVRVYEADGTLVGVFAVWKFVAGKIGLSHSGNQLNLLGADGRLVSMTMDIQRCRDEAVRLGDLLDPLTQIESRPPATN